MSEPLGDKRKRLDNLLQSTVEEHNQQADELLGVFQRDFPRTYRLLDGSHFQLPARRGSELGCALSRANPLDLLPHGFPKWAEPEIVACRAFKKAARRSVLSGNCHGQY